MTSKDAGVGIVDSTEVGAFAAILLSASDPSVHNHAKYVLNGPEDITGEEIVNMVEQHIGTKIVDVSYKDTSFIDALYENHYSKACQSKNLIMSIKTALETAWDGQCTSSTTSKEVLKLGAPKHTPTDVMKSLLEH